jgi:hypothetical protein
MPRGVPKAGFRLTKNKILYGGGNPAINKMTHVNFNNNETVVVETDEQIEQKLAERFGILELMAHMAISGECRALIVSGPAGLGKSYTIEQALEGNENATFVKGYVRPTALYRLLHANSQEGDVIVFDDCDSIFFDDTSINLLKAVCDSTDKRVVSYMTEANLVADDGENLPKQFQFKGTVIFITNYDFDDMITRGHKLSPHLQALVSRAHYVDLAMKTKRDYIVRIKQVCGNGILDFLSNTARQECIDYIEKNSDRLRELSLRMALKIGTIRKMNPNTWQNICNVTCLRNN